MVTLPSRKAAPSSVRKPLASFLPVSGPDRPLYTEYLLRKYGKQRQTLPGSAQIDDIYCTASHNFSLTTGQNVNWNFSLTLCRGESHATSLEQDCIPDNTRESTCPPQTVPIVRFRRTQSPAGRPAVENP